MSSTQHSFQDQNYSSGFQEIDPSKPKHFLKSQSQEKQAIAASVDELDESRYRSPSQQSAVELLRDFEDSKVLYLLSVIRLSGQVDYPYLEGLSNEQLDALSHLKFCTDSHIVLWLRHSRVARSQSQNPHSSGLPTPQSAVTSGSRNALRRPLRTSLRPSSTFPGHLSAHGAQITHDTTRDSLGRHRSLKNSPRQVFTHEPHPSRTTNVQFYWCIDMFCERHLARYPYTTRDGWKRHMKEHNTVWLCMPDGPLETAEMGLKCALCGSLDPDEDHMAGHSIGHCGDTSTKLRGVSRRTNLEKHLKSHGVSDGSTRALADRWEKTLRKKHFACGFCICIFSTIHEQLNHIVLDHFKQGQEISQWCATKVIRGLLLSPKVASSFQCILLSDPYAINRDLHWDWHIIEDLQRRLEMAEDAAETLAFEAYRTLTFNLNRQNSYGQHPAMSFSGLKFVGQSELATGSFAVSAESLEKNSEHQIEELAQGSEHTWFSDESHVTAHSISCSMANYGLPTNQFDTSKGQASMNYQRAYHLAPRGFPTVSASSFARPQTVYSPIQTGSASSITELSSTSSYDSSDTSTHLQAAPSTTPSTLYSTGSADRLREHPMIYEGPAHNVETAGTLTPDLEDLAHSTSVEVDSFLLDTCDPRDLVKKSR